MRRFRLASITVAVLLWLLFTGTARAARLTNGTSDYLSSASSLTLSGSAILTISFWLWWDNFSTNDDFAMDYRSGSNKGAFLIDPNSSGVAGKIQVELFDLSPTIEEIALHDQPSNGAWHHYVYTFNRSGTGADQITGQWIDGVATTGQSFVNADVQTAFGDFPLFLMNDNAGAGLFGAGRIAEVALYSGYAFVQGDVDSLYNGGAGKDARTVQTPTYYWQLCGRVSPEPALVGGINMTVTGATSTTHPISGAGICDQVLFDAVGTAQNGNTGTSASIPITIGSGASRAVVVGFTGGNDTVGITCTMNSGAETLTVVSGSDGGGTTGTVILGKATALSGAQTVACSWTNSQNYAIDAMSFTGVDPTTPFNHGTFGTGAPPFSLAVTSTSGDLTTTINGTDNGATPTTNQTRKWAITHGAGDIGPGTGSTTHIWSGGTLEFASGVNIRKVQAAASGLFRMQGDLTGVGTGGKFHKDPLQ